MSEEKHEKIQSVLEEVLIERIKQHSKWNEQNHQPIEWIAILTEEVGEAAKEAVDYHFKNPKGELNECNANFSNLQKVRLANYRTELVQIAAVTVQMIESLDRNEGQGL